MLPSKHSRNNSFQAGFAPIWIILIIFLLGGLFLAKGNLSNISKNTQIPSASPSSTPAAIFKSIWDFCNSEIKNMPKLPFSYEKIVPTGSSADFYRTDRIKDKKRLKDYASCGLNYQFNSIAEKTYADLGLKYYEYSKQDPKTRWSNTPDVIEFPKKIDTVYGDIVGKQGWERQTKLGGEVLASGLPTLIYHKDMGDMDYYIDVVVGPSSVTLGLMVVKK